MELKSTEKSERLIFPEDKINEDAKNELNKILELEKTIDRKNLIFKIKK